MSTLQRRINRLSRRSFFGKVAQLGFVAAGAGLIDSVMAVATKIPAIACSIGCGDTCYGYCACCAPGQIAISSCDHEDPCCRTVTCSAVAHCGSYSACIRAKGLPNGGCTWVFC